MRKFLLLLGILFISTQIMAQQYPFTQKWEKVESEILSGKTKSLAPLLDEIYLEAKKSNHTDDLIKALIYKSKIAISTSDDKDIVLDVRKDLEQEIAQSKDVQKAILQSVLAQLYFNYYTENYYRFQNRTDVNENDSEDFRTWSTEKFLGETDGLLQSSLTPKNKLFGTNIDAIKLLIQGDDKYRFLQPTVYDILAYSALNIYRNNRFEDQSFDQKTKDERIDEIYNSLIQAHLHDKDQSALIQYKIEQLQSQKEKTASFDMISALRQLDKKYHSEPWSTNILAELSAKLQEEDQLTEALQVAKEAQLRFPNTYGAERAKQIQKKIEKPHLSFHTDGTFYANQSNVLNVSHTNLDRVYYRVYKLNKEQVPANLNGFEYDYKTDKLKPIGEIVLQDEIQLKKFTDYKAHTTHLPFPALAAGNYVILFSENTDFEGKIDHHLFQASIVATNLDFASRIDNQVAPYSTEVQFLNKSTGLPKKNMPITLYQPNRDQILSKLKSYNTDAQGRVNFSDVYQRYYRAYIIEVETEDEHTFFATGINNNHRARHEDDWINQVKIFTDRAIYRPGQTVYFKGILYQSKEKERRIITDQKIEVDLYDVNGEKVSSLKLVSNEFGSVQGEFILPSSGLTGTFRIGDDWSNYRSSTIQVEEYKRPKFRVEIDTLDGIYQLNQKVNVSGRAKSFSGANITDAKVVYRVFRKSFNPYSWWWRPMPSEEVDMVSGETTTNQEGVFNFDFTALPKESEAKGKRAYSYRIVADVTDISGETHSIEQSVRIGDIPLQLSLKVPDKISRKEFNQLKINATNLNGQKTEANGKLSITEIKPLDRVLRPNQTQTDYELWDKASFISKLPFIAYDNEHLIENRPRLKTIVQENWNTATSNTIKWSENIPAGLYEIKAISIYKNDTIATQHIVEVTDDKITNTERTYFDVRAEKSSLQPGDKAVLTFLSNAVDANVQIELEANGEIIKEESLKLDPRAKFEFPITEDYRGGVFVHAYFSKFNQSISRTIKIDVPYTNKELDVKLSSFRDKLSPGEDEKWTLTVKDKLGEKFLAEVLVGMYDKSLDQFIENPYDFSLYGANYSGVRGWNSDQVTYFRNLYREPVEHITSLTRQNLNLFRFSLSEYAFREYRMAEVQAVAEAADVQAMDVGGIQKESAKLDNAAPPSAPQESEEDTDSAEEIEKDLNNVPVRKNLQETAFFFPQLTTDASGNVSFEFTAPESLTQWNFQAVAHTKDLKTGVFQADFVTQKELMVVPNAPRFLREGDKILFKTKIVNLSEEDLRGDAQLKLFDAFSMEPIEAKFKLSQSTKDFSVTAGGDTSLSWALDIPEVDDVASVVYRVVASTGKFSDGEENALPILTNRMMVTETLPIHVREHQSNTFTFDKLVNSTSETRDNFKLTMEMTTNPVWYAVMALPYLREYPYECSEQVFARFYGNIISQSIVNSNPKIKAVFDDWNKKGQLISPLEKNQELKNILLEETPWVRNAQNEAEQMKRMALLFDLNKMQMELRSAYKKLEQKQSANGGFAWFEGGRENTYITTHIVAGFGHLDKMGIDKLSEIETNWKAIPHRAIDFIDNKMIEKWDKYQANKERYGLSNIDGLYWLYARSYFLADKPLSHKLQKVRDHFLTELDKDKLNMRLQGQAMLALTFQRYGKKKQAEELIFAIKDRAVDSEEMGMYWKENVSGYSWYEAPVETQAMLIEAFDEITPKDVESVESMKVWLLKNKQTNQWNSTKATTEAVYALMNTGKSWIDADKGIEIKIGDQIWYNDEIRPGDEIQRGSGYVKESWSSSEIKPKMGNITVTKTSPGVAWGAMYWQYFEDLDKITNANTNVSFKKQLFIQRNTPQGPKLFEITEKDPIQIGDLVKVRLEIQTDRAMEFVHIKDMRASGFEPVNVLSTFKWQDGLGYYESTRDAATNFFVDYLPKGVYVFEYELRANNAGTFSNGITQLQNMYAPEFTAHSDGLEVEIQ